MILQPALLSTLLLILPSNLANGKRVKGIDSCFPDELPRAPDPNFSKDVTKFSLKLFKSLVTKGDGSGQAKNLVFSPFSVWSALVIAYLSAEGRTKEEIKRALKLETKIGTHSDWMFLQQQLTERQIFRRNPSTTTTITNNKGGNRKARQTVSVIDNSSTSSVQSSSATSSQDTSESSSSSQTQEESVMTVSIGSKSKVEQCVTDTNGATRCSTDNQLTRSEDSTTTETQEGSSSSSSSQGTNTQSSSSSSTTTCVNGVCQTTSTSDASGNKELETCATDTDGVKVCTTESCITDASGTETCTTNTCTTDESGTETCVSGRSSKKAEETTRIRTAGRPSRKFQDASVLPKSGTTGSLTTDVKETAMLPNSGTPGHPERNAGETATSLKKTLTTTRKNCTKDSKSTLSCTIETCIDNGHGTKNCSTKEMIDQMNQKKGKAQAHRSMFTSKNWAYVSENMRLKSCLPSTLPEITPIDFSRTASAAQTINMEVRRATGGIIDNLVEAQDLVGAEFLLLNAVHFKGEWETSFPVENTKMEDFYILPPPAALTGSVEMMRVVGKFKYETAEMGVETVAERLNFKRLQDAMNKMQENEIEVSLPRFSVTTQHSEGLKQALSDVGVRQLFSTPLNLSPLTSTPLRLHSVIQQAAIQVNEEGTTFAAATGLLGTRLGPVKVKYNRPFIFLLMDTNHHIPVAAGVYRQPTA